ncbi:hypothetical protein ACO0RG_000510 [Hanseniaspora osmophila]
MGVLRNLFRYRRSSVSILTLFFYVSVALYFYIYNEGVPQMNYSNEDAYLLDPAWLHLQEITKHPHPYSSHENDRVHAYLFQQINKAIMESGRPEHVSVSDDEYDKDGLKALFKQHDVFDAHSTATRLIYYESSNILVKIDGTLGDSVPGLLLSAHYDSVPLGNGATDDGKGIATLFALFQHYMDNQPARTVIFNFNNNEEFGLLGASIFGYHPWHKLVDSVINLEGTGTGGSKAVLFRTSDTQMAKIYKESVKDQPFGNSMYQQGFYNRFVGSETDYKVYQEQQGLRGWDIAFIKPRDLYHTWKDSVRYTDRDSLYHMLHTAFQLSNYALNENLTNYKDDQYDASNEKDDLSPAVFFDLGGKFYAFSARSLFQINIVALVCFPILIIVTLLLVNKSNLESVWTWAKLPISMAVSFLIVSLWSNFLQDHNVMIVSRNYWVPIMSYASIFLLSHYFVLRFILKAGYKYKTVAMLEVNFAMWVYLTNVTIQLKKHDYKDTGAYPFSIFYLLLSIGTVCGILLDPHHPVAGEEETFFEHSSDELNNLNDEPTRLLNGSNITNHKNHSPSYGSLDHEAGGTGTAASSEDGPIHDIEQRVDTHEKKNALPAYYGWLLQYLVVVPGSLFILFNAGGLIIDALNQTVQDGDVFTDKIYKFIPLIAILIIVPILPFVTRLNYITILIVNCIMVISVIFSLTSEPFTESLPLKIRCGEYWDLNVEPHLGQIYTFGREVTSNFMESVIMDLPSQKLSKHHTPSCTYTNGNALCKYKTIPLTDGHRFNSSTTPAKNTPYNISVEVLTNNRKDPDRSKYEPISSRFRINVDDNRACTLRFPQAGNNLREVYVFDGENQKDRSEAFYFVKPDKGIDELQLHKLNFSKPYHEVELVWLPQILVNEGGNGNGNTQDELKVDVSCYWGDYITFDEQDNSKVKVNSPGLMELFNYSPKNVIYTNREKGMIISEKSYIF